MRRVLLISTTTGYQTRSFSEAAQRLGVDLVFATDRCHRLEDPWRDKAIPVRFHEEEAFIQAVRAENQRWPFDGLLALGDRPAVFAALANEALCLSGHPPVAARRSGNKLETRKRFADAGLPCPVFREMSLESALDPALAEREFPCVVKPLALSGSRGVIRVDNPEELAAAIQRVRRLLARADIRQRRHCDDSKLMLESFIPGLEYAVEGVIEHGVLRVLALFDKPDPLNGPYFEESIYVTPSVAPVQTQRRIEEAVSVAVQALGLHHGPVHAECRVNAQGVFVLEVAARPIGGLCAKTLRFLGRGGVVSLEELLLRHSLGESMSRYRRETTASAVMMIPIPGAGVYRRTDQIASASAVPGVVDLVITAKADQRLEPPPEGASYLGFIFARAPEVAEAVTAVRESHAQLEIVIETPIPMA